MFVLRLRKAATEYSWPILRLSLLVAIVAMLLVATLPSLFSATAIVTPLPGYSETATGANKQWVKPQVSTQITAIYLETLRQNMAISVASKLKKFSLADIDQTLAKTLSAPKVITQIKQSLAAALPFMPQQDRALLSPKQVTTLKSQFPLEKIEQHLQLNLSSELNEARIEYRDTHEHFATIVASLAAHAYKESVLASEAQLSERISKYKHLQASEHPTLNKPDAELHFKIPGAEQPVVLSLQELTHLEQLARYYALQVNHTELQTQAYASQRLKPKSVLLVSMCFLFCLVGMLALVVFRDYLLARDKQLSALPEVPLSRHRES